MPRQSTSARAAAQSDGEDFDLRNVSSDEDNPPVGRHRGQDTVPIVQVINNPDSIRRSKNAAADVWHFFEKNVETKKSICRECQ